MFVDGVLVLCYVSWFFYDIVYLVMVFLRVWKWLVNYFVLFMMLMENGFEVDEILWYVLIFMILIGMFN